MKIIRGLHKDTRALIAGCVATIGKFDGVHLGHQYVINAMKQQAATINLPTVVILFEPHPQEFFHPEQLTARLTRLREKLFYLTELKVDYVLVLPFNHQFATMSALDFVNQILIKYLHVKHFFVGDDFYFGARREGDLTLLKQLAEAYRFTVTAVPPYYLQQQRVSSSLVRATLARGDFALVKQLLGRPYSLHGRIIHGAKRGRTIGFPTANIALHRTSPPLSGVYAVQVLGINHEQIPGVANIGLRPTVDGTNFLLEVYLFDFHQDIYGCYVQVEILHKIRAEKHFASFELLKEQIQHDVIAARHFFGYK